jgi:subfamily B ATP-binding cassette protein MsbA
LRGLSRKAQQNIGDLTQVVDEAVGGHRVVKLFGGEEYEQTRFRQAANLARLFEMKRVAANAVYEPIIQFIAAVALAAIVYIAEASTTPVVFSSFRRCCCLPLNGSPRSTTSYGFSMLDQDAERDTEPTV